MPLIPRLSELVRIGVDFSAAPDVKIAFQPDQQLWEVLAGNASRVKVYANGEYYSQPERERLALPITGGAFAILLGYPTLLGQFIPCGAKQ